MLNQAKIELKNKLATSLLLVSVLLTSVVPQVSKAQETDYSDAKFLPLAGPRAPRKVIKAVITAYSSTPDQTDGTPFIAANNERVYDGLIAVNWLPFGTRVKFPELFGDKIFTVNDRMNSRYLRPRVDIWMDAPRAELLAFGVKRVTMEIF